jgi:hypothetical protein
MRLSRKALVLVVVSLLVTAGISATAFPQAPDPQETGPVYSIEGAWYGITTFPGSVIPPTPTFDTFTSNAQRPGAEGTFLCTIPGALAGNQTPSGHGNWVRIATNTYAYTAVRAIFNGSTGTFVGWAKFWGTITAVSDDELTGTINAQFFLPNWTPMSGQSSGTLERHRIGITFEQ